MKKLLCVLLVMVLLSGTALADSYQGQIRWEADVSGVLAYLSQSTEEEKALQSLAEGMAELANGLDISFFLQDDGVYGAVSLKDTLLADMTVFGGNDYATLLSSLLPGHYLHIAAAPADAAASMAAVEKLEATDWEAITLECLAAFDAWLSALPKVEEQGSFSDNAFEGGTSRESYSFDDSAVATLVNSMLAVLEKHGIDDALLEDYLGAPDVLNSFVGWNEQIAQENRYQYTLHWVHGSSDAPICLSLVVKEADAQVMTFSLAAADNGWRGVWGYGLEGQNYYLCAEMLDGAAAGEKNFAMLIYLDPEKVGYREVEPYPEYVLLMAEGSFALQDNEQETRWQAEVEVVDPLALIVDSYYVLDGARQHESGSVKQTLAWHLPSGEERAEEPMVSCILTVDPCEPQVWSTENLTAIDVEGGVTEDQLMLSLMEESLQELVVKLFKLIPTQLLTMLM